MPQKFGKYTLVHRIAVGGMADIYVARSKGMEGFSKTVVIKRIRSHLSKKTSFVNMFLNEAKLAAQLSHSNIAQIFDLGKIEDSYFIAMEYVWGRDMRAVIPKATKLGIDFPLEYSLKIAAAVCEGLYYAHRKTDDDGNPLNIVHRDVTPENIMVSFDGEVKILDFGIAKAENLVSETRAGQIKGKLGYMSPEQVTGKALDQRSDLFSLGVVLYEWITGHKLFGGKSDVEVLRNVIEGKIYPPTYFKEDIPDAVEDILMRVLQRNREERYQSAWELQYDINQFLSRHEFSPTNIHLSNFLRQIFSDELASEPRTVVPEELDDLEDLPGDDQPRRPDDFGELGTVVVPEGTLPKRRLAPDGRKRTRTDKPFLLGPDQRKGHNPGVLDAEKLVGENGHLAVPIEIKKADFERLKAVAERNAMTVPELIRDLIEQWTKYL